MVTIVPLELWDVLVDGRSLFARRAEPTFFGALASAAIALRRGDAVRETAGRLAAVPWNEVAIVGGGVDVSRARAAFAASGVALDLVSDDPFFAVSSAFDALVCERGGDVVVIDVGQTAIKALGPSGRVHQLRRPAGQVQACGAASARDGFVEDLSRALSTACAGRAPSLVLMGVPCEVETRGDRLVLGESSYPTGADGDVLIGDLLARCGFDGTPVRLVNDAVLAAQAFASASASASEARSRLVLTIGHGVGGAFVTPLATGSA